MIGAEDIGSAVRRCIVRAATTLRPDVLSALRLALERESSSRGRLILGQLIENSEIAESDKVPLCQDTGYVWVLLEVGYEECLCGDVGGAIDSAVAEAYRTASLRASVVFDAFSDRSNTGDNTPAFIDVAFRPGSGVTVHVMLKGGGSDNSSAVRMLAPGQGEEGVRRFVVDTVAHTAAAACPPIVVGVGVGATFDKVGLLAKKALLREMGTSHPDVQIAALEGELLEEINEFGIGPGGLGGDTTALAVHVLTAPCHIAALPVAVNIGCVAMRSVSTEVV